MNPSTTLDNRFAHPFDQALQLRAGRDEDHWLGCTSPAYANMVGPFGGLTAAQALAGVLAHPKRLGEPVALTVNFAAAVADGAFDLIVRPVRTNRSTQHWTIELRQGDAVALTGTALTALRRDSWGNDEATMPTAPAADATAPARRRERQPVWLDRYDLRFIDGELPARFEGQEAGHRSLLWLRDAPPRPLDFTSLAALADAFFPRLMLRRGRLAAVGSVSITTYFHADAAQLTAVGAAHILGEATAAAFRHGYFDQTARLWSPAGPLLASSHQIVYFKE
ncbi:MAG: thioesterase family protein [Burkholderiales bacterium]